MPTGHIHRLAQLNFFFLVPNGLTSNLYSDMYDNPDSLMSCLREWRWKKSRDCFVLDSKKVDTRTVEGNVFSSEDGDSMFLRNVDIYL
jgi:hypothetical protein